MHFATSLRKSHRLLTPHHRANAKRRYSASAATHGPNPAAREALHPRPPLWPADINPTPYQVLHLEPGSPYNDRRHFSRLVKMYHPDMHHHHHHHHHSGDGAGSSDVVSPEERLRRYYLVIAAHELLSSPEQRRRYDLYKLGWMNHSPPPFSHHHHHHHQPAADAWPADTRPSPMQKSPIYMSNHTFAILALAFALGCAIVSYERVRKAALRERQRVHLVDKELVKSLYQAKYLMEGRSKDDRILDFLCRRHVASGGGDQDGASFLLLGKDWEQNICRH